MTAAAHSASLGSLEPGGKVVKYRVDVEGVLVAMGRAVAVAAAFVAVAAALVAVAAGLVGTRVPGASVFVGAAVITLVAVATGELKSTSETASI